MSPSKIDVEIRCLSPKNGALFLQIHFEIAVNYPAVMEVLEELSKDKSWDRIQEMINYCLCASNYIRGAVI
ncbi:hypothetical protein CEXT_700791 [Caerostris extrusa]|uniref:Uncharacterized protein n=1 Tax=Caerostris extrusa TaxID=172846 RepID=A0AAV4N8N0_CAEEX|nr:hypothetical protein CEXT_700791 [Caerostris extrusa]